MNHDDSGVGIDRRQRHPAGTLPFQDGGDIHVFYGGGGRAEVLEAIVRGRRSTFSAVHVHGERGSGRTLLSLVLADRLERSCNVIRHAPLAEPGRDPAEAIDPRAPLLRHLLIELCPADTRLIGAGAIARGADAAALAAATRRVLRQLRRPPPGDRPYLLVVDADETDAATLALLERLAGVRRGERPAMHVVVFRRTEGRADGRADGEGAREAPGREARAGHHHLRRLTLAEVGDYLAHRMMLFDFNRRDLFTREMVYFLADRSEGVIGTIDTLARNAFALAGLQDDERPSLAHLLATGLPPRAEPAPRAPRVTRFVARHRRALVALAAPCVVASTAALLLLASRFAPR